MFPLLFSDIQLGQSLTQSLDLDVMVMKSVPVDAVQSSACAVSSWLCQQHSLSARRDIPATMKWEDCEAFCDKQQNQMSQIVFIVTAPIRIVLSKY